MRSAGVVRRKARLPPRPLSVNANGGASRRSAASRSPSIRIDSGPAHLRHIARAGTARRSRTTCRRRKDRRPGDSMGVSSHFLQGHLMLSGREWLAGILPSPKGRGASPPFSVTVTLSLVAPRCLVAPVDISAAASKLPRPSGSGADARPEREYGLAENLTHLGERNAPPAPPPGAGPGMRPRPRRQAVAVLRFAAHER